MIDMNANRSLSVLLAVIYIALAAFARGAEAAFKVGIFVVLPLACIWFSESMGGYVGPVWRAAITSPSPAIFVCITGWILLLLPVIIGIVYAISKA
jgi:hypothetical protein